MYILLSFVNNIKTTNVSNFFRSQKRLKESKIEKGHSHSFKEISQRKNI